MNEQELFETIYQDTKDKGFSGISYDTVQALSVMGFGELNAFWERFAKFERQKVAQALDTRPRAC